MELHLLRVIAAAAQNLCEEGCWTGGSNLTLFRCPSRWADALAQALTDAGYTVDAKAACEGVDVGFGRWMPKSYQERRDAIAQQLWESYEGDEREDEWQSVPHDIAREYLEQAEHLLHLAGVTP